MSNIQLDLKEKGEGAFYILEDEEKLGEMQVSVSDKNLTVFHTEVAAKAEGKGLAKQLFAAMTDHARKNHLQIVPLCSYVQALLKRNPKEYADIWSGGGKNKDAE